MHESDVSNRPADPLLLAQPRFVPREVAPLNEHTRPVVASHTNAAGGRGDARLPARRASHVLATLAVAATSALLFATTVTGFKVRVTDVSALRILDGDVPYRDFWTMYAPASSYATAAGFWLFGRELIVSNLLGLVVSAASVAAFHRLTLAVMRPVFAVVASAIVAAAFYGTGYHAALTSYPLASLVIWLAWHRILVRADERATPRLAAPGLLFALAIASKHDVAAYAGLACATSLLAVSRNARPAFARLGDVVRLGACVAAGLTPIAVAVLVYGAGPDLVRDLFVFPVREFPGVRWETWPGWPTMANGGPGFVLGLRALFVCNGPLAVALVAAPLLWWRRARLSPSARRVALASALALPVLWSAAHVQLNTHAITLAALASLLAGIAATPLLARSREREAHAAVAAIGLLVAVLYAGPTIATTAMRWSAPLEPVALPGLRGIRVGSDEARWMRGLADAMTAIAPPQAPLLFAGRRNDVLIHAQNAPAWLSPRKPATRYSELHPGITDTEAVQREMIDAVDAGLPPVVVREHRFEDAHLDRVKARYLEHVRVGATELDAFLEAHYQPGELFGIYEVMRPRDGTAAEAEETSPR